MKICMQLFKNCSGIFAIICEDASISETDDYNDGCNDGLEQKWFGLFDWLDGRGVKGVWAV